MFPKLFGRIAELYMQRYPSLTEHDLARVAVKNYLHAHLNPLAQMRDTDLDFTTASTESQKNWRIAASPLKLYDCSQITDGGGGGRAVLGAFPGQARRTVAVRRALPSQPRAAAGLGSFHGLPRAGKEGRAAFSAGPPRVACTRSKRAGIHDPRRQLHGVEVHDCFSVSEVIAYEIIGWRPARREPAAQRRDDAAACARRFSAPTRPPPFDPRQRGGGLMADGHPVGATGVRQVLDAYQQLTGRPARADRRREPFLTYNVGGSMTTTVAMVWGT